MEQINAGWAWEMAFSKNKFVFSNCEKYTVLWAKKICWAICFHLYSPKARFWKDKFSQQNFKKISWQLHLCKLLLYIKFTFSWTWTFQKKISQVIYHITWDYHETFSITDNYRFTYTLANVFIFNIWTLIISCIY